MSNSRRKFLKSAALAGATFTILPRHVLGGPGFTAPSDKVNIAFAGAGGKGWSAIQNMSTHNIVALCDIDSKRAAEAFEAHPSAKRYQDYRKMLEQKDIDAVVVSTPDHTHYDIGILAMQLDKHLYLEKPLAHNIAEVRGLTEMAKEKPQLITQMGNQGASGEGIRQTQEIYQAGLLGDVHTVYAWTNRPIWPQGGKIPTESQPVPDHIDWDLWLGPAEKRPYNEAFHPFAWRGYWDFGTGALGDMGCHILDTPFYTLELGYPVSAEASVGQVYSQNWSADYNPGSCPPSSKIHIQFPARGEKPAVELIWSDGGILPGRPKGLKSDEPLGDWSGGIIMEGTEGTLLCDTYGRNPRLVPTIQMQHIKVEPTLARVTTSHEIDWLNGIVQGYQPSSNFMKSGPLTETVLMGNLAIRAYDYRAPKAGGKLEEYTNPGRTTLHWDGPNMRITNVEELNRFVARQERRKY